MYRNKAHEYFSSMADEEFYGLLEEAGFELENGEGKVIYDEMMQSEDVKGK